LISCADCKIEAEPWKMEYRRGVWRCKKKEECRLRAIRKELHTLGVPGYDAHGTVVAEAAVLPKTEAP
jgi:hypothetical protein